MISTKVVAILGLSLAPFALAATHDVIVGGSQGILQFHPEAIVRTHPHTPFSDIAALALISLAFAKAAAAGDHVVFHFQQKNHTVTQSSFANPCGHKDGGLDSGLYVVFFSTLNYHSTWPTLVSQSEMTLPTSQHTRLLSMMYVTGDTSTAAHSISVFIQTQPIWMFCNQAAGTPNSHCGKGMFSGHGYFGQD